MPNKKVTYTAPDGRMFYVEVPEDAPEHHYRFGVVLGPPDLKIELDTEQLNVRIHNELYARQLLTLHDLRHRPADVVAAIQAAVRIDAQELMAAWYSLTESNGVV